MLVTVSLRCFGKSRKVSSSPCVAEGVSRSEDYKIKIPTRMGGSDLEPVDEAQ